MSYILGVFTSRNETLYFFNMLKKNGCYCDIISTPNDLGKTCGISVRFRENCLTLARTLMQGQPFRTFFGFFKVSVIHGKQLISRI